MANVSAPQGKRSVTVPTSTTLDQRVDAFELDLEYDDRTGERLRRKVKETELPEDLRDIVDTYQEVLDDRNEYQWQWLYRIFGSVTLPCVPERHMELVREVKTIMAMYNAILDDLAEEHDDPETFWELAKVAYPGPDPDWDRPDIDRDYATVVREVWEAIDRKLRQGPRYEEFIEQYLFGLRRALTSMDHSRLSMNHSGMANLTETWLYGPHNLMVHAFMDTDLMFSPSFSKEDYDEVREMAHTFQQMWRIGNWVATWEREIHEHDYSAGVVVAALQADVITHDMLDKLEAGEIEPKYVIECIRDATIEEAFLADWQRRRDELLSQDYETESVDLKEFVKGTETLMQHHLASRGQMKQKDDA